MNTMQGARVTKKLLFSLLLGLCATASAASPTTGLATLAVPDPGQRGFALRQINELRERHPLEYGAARLLELSRSADSSPAMRFAAAYRAMELAATSGHVTVAMAALEHLEKTFDADPLELREHLVRQLLDSPQRSSAAILAMRFTEDVYRTGRIKEAAPFARAVQQCQKELSSELQHAASAYLEDYEYATNCGAAIVTCLYRGGWAENLSALAEGDDPLAEIAKRDLEAKDDAAKMLVADAWWSAGEERGGTTGWRIARRSAEIYRELLPRAGSLERELIASRLAAHDGRWLRSQGYVSGLSREIWRGDSRERRKEIAANLEIERDDAKLDLPRTGGHVAYRGFILVTTPGRHELILTAGSSMKLLIDGEVLVDDPAVYRKRSGQKVVVELSAGLREIELEVWASSSQPRLHVEWITPGSSEKRSISQTSFFYDPLKQ